MSINKVIRTRVEWTVDNRTNSSFLILDALGGMLRGKVEIAKTSIAVLEGYDLVKWMVDFSDGHTEEFTSRADLFARFNAENLSNPDPSSTEVDWKIDISSEQHGVVCLWLYKELHEGTTDPEGGSNNNADSLTHVDNFVGPAGLTLRLIKLDGSTGSSVVSAKELSDIIPFWCIANEMDANTADNWLYMLTVALKKANDNIKAGFMAEIMNGMNG